MWTFTGVNDQETLENNNNIEVEDGRVHTKKNIVRDYLLLNVHVKTRLVAILPPSSLFGRHVHLGDILMVNVLFNCIFVYCDPLSTYCVVVVYI